MSLKATTEKDEHCSGPASPTTFFGPKVQQQTASYHNDYQEDSDEIWTEQTQQAYDVEEESKVPLKMSRRNGKLNASKV
jgi:hypothetical protein